MTTKSATKSSIAHFATDVREHRKQLSLAGPNQGPLRSCLDRRGLLAQQDADLAISLGEVIPFIFYELAGIKEADNSDITEAWYQLYHATILIDDISDGDCELNVRTFLEAIAMTQEATARFLGTCSDGSVRALVQNEMQAAIRGQKADIALQGIASQDRKYADFQKNRLVRALAILVGSRSGNGSDLVNMADRMIPIFQMLDDLGDLHEDHQRKNWTGLLVQLLSPSQLSSLPGGEKYLVWEILRNKNLSPLLAKMGTEMNDLKELLDSSQRTKSFLREMQCSLDTASSQMATLESLVATNAIGIDAAKRRFDRIAVVVAQSS